MNTGTFSLEQNIKVTVFDVPPPRPAVGVHLQLPWLIEVLTGYSNSPIQEKPSSRHVVEAVTYLFQSVEWDGTPREIAAFQNAILTQTLDFAGFPEGARRREGGSRPEFR